MPLSVGEALDTHFWQSSQPRAGLPGGENERDRLRQEPPSHEREHLARRLIKPLGILDQADERSFLSHLRQEAQHGESEEEAVRGESLGQPERRAERRALWSRQSPEAIQQRRAELMQPGECEFHLRLNGRRGDHVTPSCSVPQVLEERGLADARLPAHDERAALSAAERVEQAI